MILFIICIIYVLSAVLVYKNIRKIYWAFLMDDAPFTLGEWVITLLPIVNTIYFIYREYLKRKKFNKNK